MFISIKYGFSRVPKPLSKNLGLTCRAGYSIGQLFLSYFYFKKEKLGSFLKKALISQLKQLAGFSKQGVKSI